VRTKFVCGNWKMHKTQAEARELVRALAPLLADLAGRVQVAVAPTFTSLAAAGEALKGTGMELAAQDVHWEAQGAFTGEVSAAMLAEVGVRPVVCVGELLAEREAGRTLEVVGRQVRGALAGLPPEAVASLTVAYEPVWAIGTGKTATTAQAQEVHAAIRALLRGLAGAAADQVRIQYGGSVKPDNAAELMSQPDVDGALVGGASLKADDFAKIVRGALR